jgi:broad specificity phosphatase PhoE
MANWRRREVLAAVAAAAAMPAAGVRADDASAAAWQALAAGGTFAIMRHAIAPGTGDPPGFRLDDCATQRNLSAAGREQARRLGAAFRANGVRVDAVYASQWCRCLETARLLDLGPVTPLPLLNSFFADPGRGDEQTARLREWLVSAVPAAAVMLVTHQVVITALIDGFPASGEIAVVRPTNAHLDLVGRIAP